MSEIFSPVLTDNLDLKKERVGQAAARLLSNPDNKQGVVDTQREMLKNYRDELIKCAKRYDWKQPFYICAWTRRERTMVNVLRTQFFARQTRPAPTYDMQLYSYDPATEEMRFEWCLPDKDTIDQILADPLGLPKDHEQLYDFCRRFSQGTLV